MIYSLRSCPPSLDLIPAKSIDDYNSINYLRAAADIAKHARDFEREIFAGSRALPLEVHANQVAPGKLARQALGY